MVEPWAVAAAIGVVIAVIIGVKLLKFAFKIAVIVLGAVLLYLLGQNRGWL